MIDLTEISISFLNNSATLFLGTGFSKFLTNGNAPSWSDLLYECAIAIDPQKNLADSLFYIDENKVTKSKEFDLLTCAQIIEVEFKKENKSIRKEIVDIILKKSNKSNINQDNLSKIKDFFACYPRANIVTTNYDDLLEKYVFENNATSFFDGKVIPNQKKDINIYHIHGSIINPNSIILTLEDYYQFQNKDSYLSKKFFTLLHENTTCILGYSLGDFNLNSILNDVKNSRLESFRKNHTIYISRDKLKSNIKKFYEYTYDIKVMDLLEISEFFTLLIDKKSEAQSLISSADKIKSVLDGSAVFKDTYLKLQNSFIEILNRAIILGININDSSFALEN